MRSHEIPEAVATVALLVIAVDFLGMLAWALSGQHPAPGFHLGSVTEAVIRTFI